MTATRPVPARRPDPLQTAFLTVLPAVEAAARAHLRHVRCPGRREDLLSEAVALAWAWHLRLAARGRSPAAFLPTFACLAARAARSGRRVCGSESVKDVLSPVCRARHGVTVAPLPAAIPAGSPVADALADNTVTPVPDQVQFRLDFPRWRAALRPRARRLADALASGERGKDLAARFALTPGRVSQVRRELYESWRAFLGDDAD